MTKALSFDFETHPIAYGSPYPRPICASFSDGSQTHLMGVADAGFEALIESVMGLFSQSGPPVVNHNISFDLACIAVHYPQAMGRIFTALFDWRNVHCTLIREKMLVLADTGDLAWMRVGDTNSKLLFGLADVMKRRFMEDRTVEKSDPTSWRTNFNAIEHLPSSQYPEEARRYVLQDAIDPIRLWEDQEERRQRLVAETGVDPFAQLAMRVALDFCLALMTEHGAAVDPEAVRALQAKMAQELDIARMPHLLHSGILIPAEPPRPYSNGARNEDGTPKMTAGSAEKIRKKLLQEYVLSLAQRDARVRVKMTDPTDTLPQGQVSVSSEWLEDHSGLDPLLDEFAHRASLQKIVTTDLPRLMSRDGKGDPTSVPSPTVHANFDVLKETGRISSFAGDKYPSFNCQNVHPEAKGAIVPRPGYLLLSVDYQQLELCTWAQQQINVFGSSTLGDIINEGIDTHAYLGAAIAEEVSPDFRMVLQAKGISGAKERYREFKSYQKHPDPEVSGFYRQFRGLAKPTNLGYPGGLGPATMIAYAKQTYKVLIDLETAKMLRKVWFATFPEAKPFLDYVSRSMEDPRNGEREVEDRDPETGMPIVRRHKLYRYLSPLGLLRSGAVFTAAANGSGLQSPAADGFVLANLCLTRACRDPLQRGILSDDGKGYRYRPLFPIHDEFVGEIREDPEILQQCIAEVREICRIAMATVCPNITIRTDAALMRRWSGEAEPKFDAAGNLVPWHPKT